MRGNQKELGRMLFIFLLFISVIPAFIVGFVGVLSTRNRLEELETFNEQGILQSQISPIASKIEVYKELIKFTSQLPAAIEILGSGQDYLGNIESHQQSVNRYSGVLRRAFQNYPEITDVTLFDQDRSEILHVVKSEDNGLLDYYAGDHVHPVSRSLFSDLLHMERNQIRVSTRRVENSDTEQSGDQLILEMMTPVFSSSEIIGVFVCSVNVGIFSRAYPDIQWVFGTGEFLGRESSVSAFFLYPDLEDIFFSGKPGISYGESSYAWIPLFSDGTGASPLWAGREVSFTSSEHYINQTYKTIIITILCLISGILLLGYIAREKIRKYYTNLYGFFERRLVEQDSEISLPLSGYSDIDRFLESIRIVVDKNTRMQEENDNLIKELKEALNNVKELKGLLPVCSSCRKVRDDDGYWANLDEYITRYTDTSISHSLCPDCLKKLYPEYAEKVTKRMKENPREE